MTISVILRRVAYYDDDYREVSEPTIYDRRVVYSGIKDYDYAEALRLIMKEIAPNEYILNIRLHYTKPSDPDDIKSDEPISKGEYIRHTEPKTWHELTIRMEE